LEVCVRVSGLVLVTSLVVGGALAAQGCGVDAEAEGTFPGAAGDDGGAPSSSGGFDTGEGGVKPASAIVVDPPLATIDVSVVDGALTPVAPVTFRVLDATTHAVVPGASWTVDRGELGAIGPTTGAYAANGGLAGTAVITAKLPNATASAKVTVQIHATGNGANAKSGVGPQTGPTPKGGFNGVGGQVLGPAPSAAIKALLGASNVVPSSTFEWLAPYDKTVFPRGILAPLVQWRTTGGFNAVGFAIHLKQVGYEFRGYYGLPSGATALTSAPIDFDVWKKITNSNQGDPLEVEISITDGVTTYGPIKRTWPIAPGILRGTVYYNSYGTQLASITQGNKAAAVLRISPGDIEPKLAVPGSETKCVVCHEVSAKGNRLFSNDTDQGDYGYARAYDLTAASAVYKAYGPSWGAGFSAAAFVGKLSYSAPSPDGTFFLASSGENYHNWPSPSDLFSADTYQAIATTGFTDTVKRAVTPAFSPDGKRVAFAFWEAVAANPLADGGHTLVAMDFDCHPDAKGVCGAPPYAFTNLRKLYTDPTAYVGWPTFSPDGKWVVFQRSTHAGDGSVLNTSKTGRADLWLASAEPASTFTPMKLCSLNGFAANCTDSYLPIGPNHPQALVDDANPGDTNLSFEPTITPIVSGGYAWLIFTSRRLYGNVATLEPYAGKDDGQLMPSTPVPKKLWVSAIDLAPKAGQDPSHPPFYLPGQELLAGNMRAFWENDPCRANGSTCETGNECCNGFCRDNGTGALVCGDKPVGCANEFETCTTAADCCGGSLACIGGKCAVTAPH
jgi:hypothetical protein